MDADKIRGIVNEVNPPVKGKPLTLTSELSGEIAKTIPFWAPLLRNRDIRGTEGGDEYISGLIETFSRIYSGLKASGAHGVLSPIDLDTLYNLDVELKKSDLGLPDEYPALEMVDVKGMGSFGGGVLMAYALLETALSVAGRGGAPKSAPAPAAPTSVPESAPPVPEAPQSLMDDLMAGLPEETSEHTVGAPPTAKPDKIGKDEPWKAPATKVLPAQMPPLMTLRVYTTANGMLVKGDLPATLYGVSQAYNVVATIFAQDANITMGPNGLEFSFAYHQEGAKP